MRSTRTMACTLMLLALFASCSTQSHAQAALLLEEPYGFFGTLNPTGHTAIYFARICAETPVKLRRCRAGEDGAVIARYEGIAGYDWVAMPLVPYLYSVENVADVPDRVDRNTVRRLRGRYHEAHMSDLEGVFEGNLVRGGWTQLVGVSYERRTYAFRFATTEEQDDDVIAQLNAQDNRSHFDLIYNNCADFARSILNLYFPRTFRRTLFPDAAMTTPRQITYKLVRYSRTHPETQLAVWELPQIPGYRRMSRSNKSVSASLITTAYAIPITIMNPYLAGGLFVDYLVRGRYPLLPEHPAIVTPDHLSLLTSDALAAQNPGSAGAPGTGAAASATGRMSSTAAVSSGMKEVVATHE